MDVLTGGARVLNLNFDGSKDGVCTEHVGVLRTTSSVTCSTPSWCGRRSTFKAQARPQGSRERRVKYTATRNDLVFGSNAQLRSIADAYAGSGRSSAVRE